MTKSPRAWYTVELVTDRGRYMHTYLIWHNTPGEAVLAATKRYRLMHGTFTGRVERVARSTHAEVCAHADSLFERDLITADERARMRMLSAVS